MEILSELSGHLSSISEKEARWAKKVEAGKTFKARKLLNLEIFFLLLSLLITLHLIFTRSRWNPIMERTECKRL